MGDGVLLSTEFDGTWRFFCFGRRINGCDGIGGLIFWRGVNGEGFVFRMEMVVARLLCGPYRAGLWWRCPTWGVDRPGALSDLGRCPRLNCAAPTGPGCGGCLALGRCPRLGCAAPTGPWVWVASLSWGVPGAPSPRLGCAALTGSWVWVGRSALGRCPRLGCAAATGRGLGDARRGDMPSRGLPFLSIWRRRSWF